MKGGLCEFQNWRHDFCVQVMFKLTRVSSVSPMRVLCQCWLVIVNVQWQPETIFPQRATLYRRFGGFTKLKVESPKRIHWAVFELMCAGCSTLTDWTHITGASRHHNHHGIGGNPYALPGFDFPSNLLVGAALEPESCSSLRLCSSRIADLAKTRHDIMTYQLPKRIQSPTQ